MAVMLSMTTASKKDVYNDKKYGTWMLLQIYRDGNSSSSYKNSYIPLSQCNESSPILKDINKQYLKTFTLENYLCPDLTNLTLRGRSVSPNYYFLYATYTICTGHDYCVNGTEREYFLKTMTAFVALGDQWFDQSDYQEPLKSYLSEKYFTLVRDRATILEYTYQNNTVFLEDSYFGFGSSVKSFPFLSSDI
eukprot:CAMPEP_0202960024 /NCGR_PEP_ID=MMETSP1396-20130829/4204_1 /ASSEMBLY_ACC=CAM_ASM_000872 /TAXON_ID= /ORGANISM="Pseudokeronopsis sp., Strain Brazil" /LENGTH=191 /DNA_ID=CAMNT_0049678985 /DNA_START=353 /DNA_END=928 /DNA_ORIENTATION=-